MARITRREWLAAGASLALAATTSRLANAAGAAPASDAAAAVRLSLNENAYGPSRAWPRR